MSNVQTNAVDTSNDETVNPHANQPNDTRLRDLLNSVRKFGRESGEGKDSLPKLAMSVVRAAADGVIDMEKDDKGNDAATRLYSEYVNAESSKAIHEHTNGGQKANVSKLRQLIGMGCMTTIDAVSVMNDAFKVREELKATDEKLKPAYHFYVDVAREQLKNDQELAEDELREIAIKSAPAGKDVEKVLQGVMKTLEALVSGEGKGSLAGLKDDSEEVEAAFQAIRDRLANITIKRETVKLMEAAKLLGLTIA